jgi:hypothetical protein
MVGIARTIDKFIDETEWGLKIDHINLVNWSFRKKQRQFNGVKIVFPRNDSRTTRHPLRKIRLRHGPYTLHKSYTKWIIGIKVRTTYLVVRTTKKYNHLEDNIEENLDSF